MKVGGGQGQGEAVHVGEGNSCINKVAVKKLNEIKMRRCKRNTMRSYIVDQLNELKGICRVGSVS